MTRRLVTIASLLTAIVSWPSIADACPICFGAAPSALLDAARLGVLAMVGVTLMVLGAFGAWFLRVRRLSAHADGERES